MSLSISGNDLVFTGTVTIANYSNPATVATLTLTPSGGVGSLPALVDGPPGLPPTFTVGTVSTLTAGSSATFTLTQTSAGGPGTASAYTVDAGIPAGAAGSAGSSGTIHGASDLTNTGAVVGDMVTVSAQTAGAASAFVYTAFPWGFVVNPSTITSISTSGQTTQQMCPLSIPAQTFSWVPVCLGSAIVVGTTNTVVSLQATLTAGSRSGDVVGEAFGYAGQATQNLSMNSGFGALVGPSQAYGVVAAGDTASIYLKATQSASTADSWAISDTTASFTVLGFAVS